MTDDNQYLCSDLDLASFLMASGIPFLGVASNGSPRLDFVFEDREEEAEELGVSFWNGTALVSPTKFADSLRRLKGALNQYQRNGNQRY
jgi:hypothetical protein